MMQSLIALRFGPSDHARLIWVGEHDRREGIIRELGGAEILRLKATENGLAIKVAPWVIRESE